MKKYIQYVENKIEGYQSHKKIAFPIFFFDDELGNRHYDFEEIAKELLTLMRTSISEENPFFNTED